jgi:hypothetical protein
VQHIDCRGSIYYVTSNICIHLRGKSLNIYIYTHRSAHVIIEIQYLLFIKRLNQTILININMILCVCETSVHTNDFRRNTKKLRDNLFKMMELVW